MLSDAYWLTAKQCVVATMKGKRILGMAKRTAVSGEKDIIIRQDNDTYTFGILYSSIISNSEERHKSFRNSSL